LCYGGGVRDHAISGRFGSFPRVGLLAGSLLQATLSVAGATADSVLPIASGRLPPSAVADEANNPALFATPTTRDHIGRVMVPVMVNGRGPFRFVVDTGANHSTISPRLVGILGLKPAGDATVMVNGITGAAPVEFVTVDSLRAGDLAIERLDLPIVWAPVLAGADGILGAVGLSQKSLIIDFERNRVEIGGYVGLFDRSRAVRIHALPPTHGLVTLGAKVGSVHVMAIIDTGSERTLGNLALRNALREPVALGKFAQLTSVYGATEEVEIGEIASAPQISIDSVHINDVAIVYGDFHVFKVWELRDQPALIIGMDVLGTVASLSIDFKNQNVYVTSTARSELPFSGHGALGESTQRR
jgi:Aspartyl protease